MCSHTYIICTRQVETSPAAIYILLYLNNNRKLRQNTYVCKLQLIIIEWHFFIFPRRHTRFSIYTHINLSAGSLELHARFSRVCVPIRVCGWNVNESKDPEVFRRTLKSRKNNIIIIIKLNGVPICVLHIWCICARGDRFNKLSMYARIRQ